jgi:hypothetical protein
MFLILVANALAADTVRVGAEIGVWAGDSTFDQAFGGTLAFERDGRFVELRHDQLDSICVVAGCSQPPNTTRTLLMVGRRWAWSHGRWMASGDLAAGVGAGRDANDSAPIPVAVGAIGQVRVSAGTTRVGLYALAAEMVGTAPFDTNVSVGVYLNVPRH